MNPSNRTGRNATLVMVARPLMMLRGMCKVIAIAFAVNQVLTTVFTYAAQRIDTTLPHQTVWLFSCMTCGLLTLWLQADARRAFADARKQGFVKITEGKERALQIGADCPKRWLVILHVELNPAAFAAPAGNPPRPR
ncbi:hypothetical protein [Paraburkholderia rhizosphaerae]|uniref:Uncharacterized protein n=1 Tax=Paraburkholderia rhizosphaerae TaxID=480658 RepID=A0A4R8LML3_9BURK|nr:hypothetical protein [Paraburkholderia rhizosphaerae]TDY46565.1 hypothetical protein BX592_113194 [Paraburkholderia rhizosphaerae]